ncbi:uncharacterized protein LAESUDRAFT_810036 [Laetiporus sulphureus 93-53]|uniref:Uncharacterized protein n=1 Tax=Laetiporus sulphureus 93-53 TaxID=1314785 RepID=A0A165GI23_9APHY|nr:uncharacterized protein LAESUDRAFT_810036 [Laetiporus sulphureus 93-53]KZT10378.1 hypothetical protein LAESUDRAFT_810036 [Laetiporus sulphureus 93-53]
MSTSITTRSSVRPLSLTGPKPLQLVDGNAQPITQPSPSSSACPSPRVTGLPTPPLTARNIKQTRRQSSISYFPSDNAPTWDVRSPTTGARPSLKRSSSVGQKTNSSVGRPERHSVGSADLQADRGPLTLTEKHADLLHFIAQKESKCLELRSQLAMHEAELAQLKRKWERIVNRGMDRASSTSTLPNLSARSPSSNGAVLDGLREGVQGVGRLLASGLNELSSPTISSSPPVPVQTLPGFTSISPALRRARGHNTTTSTSSVSTAGTSSTSTHLSQSSASSFVIDELEEKQEELPVRGSVEISPASARQAARLRRRSRDITPAQSPLPESPTTPSAVPSRTSTSTKRTSVNLASGLAPPALIPGMGTMTVPPMSAWMESVGSSVGRKWEELQKGETFTRSQKRASIILSDVSQSFFSALASPASSSGAASVSISSNPFAASLSPLSTSPTAATLVPNGTSSLLDDDEPAQGLGSVLSPDSKGFAPSKPPAPSSPSLQAKDQSDDEWNW